MPHRIPPVKGHGQLHTRQSCATVGPYTVLLSFSHQNSKCISLNIAYEVSKLNVHVKIRFTYIATQLPHMPRWRRFHQRPANSLGFSPSPWPRTLSSSHADVQLYIAVVCRFNGLHLHNPCKRMDYYSFTVPVGIEG